MNETSNDVTTRSASVSVGAIVRHFGGVLLVKCETANGASGEWQLPRAIQRRGETLQQVLERAVLMQTGVRVAAGDIVQVYDLFGDGDDHVVMLDFEAAYLSGDLRPDGGVLDVAWASALALRSMEVEENTAELLSDMGFDR